MVFSPVNGYYKWKDPVPQWDMFPDPFFLRYNCSVKIFFLDFSSGQAPYLFC